MKLSLNWLRSFISLDLTTDGLVKKLVAAGIEVEGIQTFAPFPESIQIVRIVSIEKHPAADRLSLCLVDFGAGQKTIVCGAQNMKPGDHVALALPGTILPDGKKIEKSMIRGVPSEGMLCSEQELGLASSTNGLWILPNSTPIGASLASVFPIEDCILDLGPSPNRGDCLSVRGIAREIAAILQKPLLPLEKPSFVALEKKTPLKIQLLEPDVCPRYTACVVRNVKVGPSPFWVRRRLESLGIKSINNVVDATNFVMLELGQPLHAFDLKKIAGDQIIVQRAKDPTLKKLTTLDGVERNLDDQDLVIRDSEKVLAIAGVMGAESSAIDTETTDLLLESAFFDPVSVRRTARRLGIVSESSHRFERGVDPTGQKEALKRLIALILDWASGEPEPIESIETKTTEVACIRFRRARFESVLGYQISDAEIETVLKSAGILTHLAEAGVFDCRVPSYRFDLEREIDLIEELARLIGYARILAKPSIGYFKAAKDKSKSPREVWLRRYLESQGFTESIHYSFCAKDQIERAGFSSENLLKIENPISEELQWMRPSLIPSLLTALEKNFSQQQRQLQFYELRSVYQQNAAGRPTERRKLALVWAGDREKRHWGFNPEKTDFYDLKGVIEGIWAGLKLPSPQFCQTSRAFLHPGLSAEIKIGDRSFGVFGAVHPQVSEAFDLGETPVFLAELDWEILDLAPNEIPKFSALPRFPAIERDLSLIVPEEWSADEVLNAILEVKSDLPDLKQVRLVDLYRGNPIPEGKKSLTYWLYYQDPEKTLTDTWVNDMHARLVSALKQKLPIEWRE